MRKLLVSLLLLSVFETVAAECVESNVTLVKELISADKLHSKGNEAKLIKFTHHDYPNWCEINLNNVNYKMHTSEGSPYYFIEELTTKKSKFYGLFKFGI
jgi:hypothetical protein